MTEAGHQAGPFASGFVAIVGRPNVGKSTLLNALVGQKLAIMSDKPQTTRNRILGVLNRPGAQVIFLDTPGIHKPLHKLGQHLNRVAEATIPDADVILYMVDGSVPLGEGDRMISAMVRKSGQPVLLVVNKLDLLPRPKMYEAMDAYKTLEDDEFRFTDIIPTSALEGTNLKDLVEIIISHLPEGPQYYPEDTVTDQPERLIMQEFIREQVLHLTREEVPHSVAVAMEQVEKRENGVVFIMATVLVERESQKGILIGEKGSMIRKIGQRARAEIEQLLGSRIYLDLRVKVKEDWRNREGALRELGYRDE